MKLIQILFIYITLLSGCSNNGEPGNAYNPGSTEQGAKFLGLGDSYTIGQSVTEAERWPVLLVKSLKNAGAQFRSPDIIATTGWTTKDLTFSVDNAKPASDYDLVSLMIGVNNQFQGRSIDEYRSEFRNLLTKSIALASGKADRVFVMSIPDWGSTPYGESDRANIAKEIDAFNLVAKDECDKQKVIFIDITPLSRRAASDPSLLARDNLHYSGKMHQLWVDAVLPLIKAKI
ncbi:SGNH/GDSL hydrolase family protein [Dyadobacter chenwenxiniae]|uniref:SGNH/GDSL hydrolase family protein n=1 Tax=Dyadobacter chenwenxiniae TaxID=2906456 RepID=A0A9X1TGB8_9BACT|nr:SGNH/GDSL hydrolase family protein [Dyadobacter chenwenxiniae]MCF0063519.1 SGNH/GDSL hydrolase family protein [Dyadobacter chenwenxiniae]UON85102.1 SGNH/GDSL hydrolase family protein [Dyadobacter chenwenxiniae]